MSIIKALQDWIKGFDGLEFKDFKEILTDITEEYVASYALAPSGSSKILTDLNGNRTYQNSYVLYAKEAAANEIDRAETYDFLEALNDWIEAKDIDEEYPDIGEDKEVENISVSNIMMFGIEESGMALYQIQIQITYTKWRN